MISKTPDLYSSVYQSPDYGIWALVDTRLVQFSTAVDIGRITVGDDLVVLLSL